MLGTHKLFEVVDGRSVELVVTCTSEAVSAAIIYLEKGQTPRLLAHTHKELDYLTQSSNQDIFDQTAAELPEVLENLQQKAHKLYQIHDLLKDHQRVHHATIFLASPWTEKQVVNRKESFDSGQEITQKFFDDLIETPLEADTVRLDSHVFSVKLNGYPISLNKILGKRAKTVELSMLESRSLMYKVESLHESVQTYFNLEFEHIDLLPLSSALHHGLHELYTPSDNYCLLYVHADHSDMFVVNDHDLVSYQAISYGYRELVRQVIEQGLAASVGQASSLLRMYNQGHLEKAVYDSVDDLITVEASIFEGLMRENLSQYHSQATLPRHCFVIQDSPLVGFYAHALERISPDMVVTPIENNQAAHLINQDQSDEASTTTTLASMYVEKRVAGDIER